jgi:bla regulator protein blaR1
VTGAISVLLRRMLLAAGASLELSVVVKATVLLICALLAVRIARTTRASVRHAFLAATFSGIAILPLVSFAIPAVPVDVSVPVIESPASAFGNAGSAIAVRQESGVATSAQTAFAPAVSTAGVLRAIWVFGAVVFLAPVVTAFIRIRRFRRTGLPWREVRPLVRRLATQAGIERPVDVLLHEDMPSPVTAGWFRPTIMLPVDARTWTDGDCRNALVHELEHVRRADWLFQVIGRVACGLYWFHPLVWIAWRRMALDAERACDDAVLQCGDGASYAAQLVNLAARQSSAHAQSALGMAHRGDLSFRVSAILNSRQRRGRAGIMPVAAIAATAVLVLLCISPLRAVAPARSPMPAGMLQAPTPAVAGGAPAFDVISIKRNNDPNGPAMFALPVGGRLRLVNQTTRMLINSSYRIQDYQIIGGPDWLRTERYDVDAIVEARPLPPLPEFLARIRTLLADRFRLVMHAETRELPIYRLVRARADGRLGPKIRPTTCKPPDPTNPNSAANTGVGGGGTCGNRVGRFSMTIGGNTMAGFANQLGRLAVIGRPVVNATNLTDTFDWELTWTDPLTVNDEALAGPDRAALAPEAVSIFTALEEQLGLKLESARGPVEVLVIDSVEHPREN